MAFDVGAIVGRLELDKKKWEQSIAAVKKDQTSLQGFVLRNEQQIKSLGRTLTVGGALVTGFFGLIMKGAINAGDYINDLSKRTGIGTETLSAYKLAADKSGTSLEGLAIGMRGLANQMQAANAGSKEGKRLFDALGVAYVDNTGKLRPLDQVMLDVADRFAQMEDGAQKTALAQDIFGRSGMELIPMLNMGRKGLEENAAAARRLGIVWSTEAARKADEFNDSLVELKAGLAGTGREIATALMPMVKSLIEKVRDIAVKVREWIAEHPALTSWITKLTLGVGLLAGALGPILMMLPKIVKSFQALKALDIANHLKGISLTQVASVGVWSAAAAAVIHYIDKLAELRDAERYVNEADKRLQETENKQIETLSKAAVAAGWHYGEMSKLITAYDGNIAALMMAIQRGKEGKDIQEALAKVSREEAREIDKLRDSTDGATDSLDRKFVPAMRNLFGIVQAGINLQRYLNQELVYFGSRVVDTAVPAARNMIGVIEQAPGAFRDMAYAAGQMTQDVRSYMQEVSTIVSDAMRNIARSIVDTLGLTKLLTYQATEFSNEYFEKAVKDVDAEYKARKDAIEKNMADEKDRAAALAKLEQWYQTESSRIRSDEDNAREAHAKREEARQNSLWNKVKGIFGTAVEEMLTVWLTKFIAKVAESIFDIGTSTAKALKGAAESVAGAVGGVAQGAAGAISGMWTGLGAAVGSFLGTVLGNLIGGGPSGHQQQQAINDTKDSRNFLAEIRNWFVSAGSGFGGASYDFITGHLLGKFDGLKGSLDLMRDQMIPRLDKVVEYTAFLTKIKFGQHGLDTTVSRPTMFMAGERGPERVTISPNFRISATPIHVHVHMDGKQVALVTAKYAPELSRDGALKIHERGLIRN